MKNIFKNIIMVTIVYSCVFTKEIDDPTLYNGDRLIVQGYVSPQDGAWVVVKKTLPPNRLNDDDRVAHAVVTVYEDNTPVAVLNRIDDYLYESDASFVPEEGKRYSVQVKADNMTEVYSAAQPIFSATPVDSFKIFIFDKNPDFRYLIAYFTHDHPTCDAYYLKTIFYRDGVNSDLRFSQFFYAFGLIDHVVHGVNSVERQIEYVDFDSTRIELYTLSPDLKKFLESQQKYSSNEDMPFFEQPHPVFDNIRGGFGIFSSYSVCRKKITERR